MGLHSVSYGHAPWLGRLHCHSPCWLAVLLVAGFAPPPSLLSVAQWPLCCLGLLPSSLSQTSLSPAWPESPQSCTCLTAPTLSSPLLLYLQNNTFFEFYVHCFWSFTHTICFSWDFSTPQTNFTQPLYPISHVDFFHCVFKNFSLFLLSFILPAKFL